MDVFFEKNFEKLINLSLKDNNTDIPKIVIWPEAALTLYLNEEIDFLNYLKEKDAGRPYDQFDGSLRP